jgi:hypothetical protein
MHALEDVHDEANVARVTHLALWIFFLVVELYYDIFYTRGNEMLLETASGEYVPVTITLMQPRDINTMRPGWTPGFNWRLYFKYANVEVYKIMLLGSDRIEGAIALEPMQDHVWVHLIEKSPLNRGALEQYQFVAHHLFAFAA